MAAFVAVSVFELVTVKEPGTAQKDINRSALPGWKSSVYRGTDNWRRCGVSAGAGEEKKRPAFNFVICNFNRTKKQVSTKDFNRIISMRELIFNSHTKKSTE